MKYRLENGAELEGGKSDMLDSWSMGVLYFRYSTHCINDRGLV